MPFDTPVLPAARSTQKPISHQKAPPLATVRLVALRDIGDRLEEKRYQPKGVVTYGFGSGVA
jgi:hypothetical protein